MTGASILLGAVFLSLGLLASSAVQESSTAAGISIGLWLLFVAIYDMALLAVLVAQGGHAIPGWLMDLALVLNPTDAYRLLTLGEGSSAMAASSPSAASASEGCSTGRSAAPSRAAVAASATRTASWASSTMKRRRASG